MKRKRTTKAAPARPAPTPRGVGLGKNTLPPASGGAVDPRILKVSPKDYCRELIRDIPDFPRPGILFKDITPLLGDGRAFAWVVDDFATRFMGENYDAIVGIESRGFIFGAALAHRLSVGFVPVRKPGKLPFDTQGIEYSLEYGTNELQMHSDAVGPGARVLVVDDLLATGGTAAATGELIRRLGAKVCAYVFAVELVGLNGRAALEAVPVYSFLQYE